MFCDYCDCDSCQYGGIDMDPEVLGYWHAQTDQDTWICHTCYTYDICTSGPDRNRNGPCENKDCKHRPKLITDWISFHE